MNFDDNADRDRHETSFDEYLNEMLKDDEFRQEYESLSDERDAIQAEIDSGKTKEYNKTYQILILRKGQEISIEELVLSMFAAGMAFPLSLIASGGMSRRFTLNLDSEDAERCIIDLDVPSYIYDGWISSKQGQVLITAEDTVSIAGIIEKAKHIGLHKDIDYFIIKSNGNTICIVFRPLREDELCQIGMEDLFRKYSKYLTDCLRGIIKGSYDLEKERISAVMVEKHDYTETRREYFGDESVHEVNEAAASYDENNPFKTKSD